MVGCATLFSNNSSQKGYTMKRSFRDSQRRAKWVENMNRKNWTPTKKYCSK